MNDYKIKKLYEDMEMELISSMKRNYQRHLKEEKDIGFEYSQWQAEKLKELKRYQKENKTIIGGYVKQLSKNISDHLKEELNQGSIKAINQYNKIMGKNLKPNKIMNHSFFRTNDRKVNALIRAVNNDLKKANTAILRMANDQYRQVIHKSAFFVANGVFTEKQATDKATKELTELQKTKLAIDEANKDFLGRGFNCIEYKNGRRVNIASYSQMAVRTASLRAQLMGEGDFRKSIGRVLVQSTSHGGACPICQKWENKIFIDDVYSGGTKKDGKYMLLSEAMKQGFLHPNCRHGLTTYYPEAGDIEDYTDEEYENDINLINNRIDEMNNDKLNYIDRNIKRFDRLEKGSISPINIQRFAQNKKVWKGERKKLVPTNDEIYSLNTYISSESYKMNEALRNDLPLDDRLTKVVKDLDTVLDKMPNYEGIVTRSVWIDSDDIERFLKDYPVGQKMSHKSFLSSTSGGIYNPEARIQMEIKSKTGKDIRKYNKKEQEILFKRNVEFYVKKIDFSDDYYVKIYLEEV